MMIPCKDYCYLRFGKQYTADCDITCDYARVVKENKALTMKVEELSKAVDILTECDSDDFGDGFVFKD